MSESSENLRAEYLLLQGIYEDYDKRALSLKALATPLLGAGLAVGLKDANTAILAATLAVALSLWVLEAIWKSFQYCHADRITYIEAWFRREEFEPEPPFQVYHFWMQAWRRRYHKPSSWLPILMQPFVFLPYLVIVVVGVVGFSLVQPEIPAPTDQTTTPAVLNQSEANDVNALMPSTPDDRGDDANHAPEAGDAAGDGAVLPGWLPVVMILLLAGMGIWFLALRGQRSTGTVARPGETSALTDQADGVGKKAEIGVAVLALAAFATALAAVTKAGQPWPLALPLLVTPLGIVIATRYLGISWLTAFVVGLPLSVLFAGAFLVPSSAAGLPFSWPREIAQNVAALTSGMKIGDITALIAALSSYLMALFGGALTGKK